MIHFTVPGEPQGKARARTYRNKYTGKSRTVTPEKTELYENWIKTCYLQQCGNVKLDGELIMRVTAYYGIPNKPKKPDWLKRDIKPKQLKELMKGQCIQPTKKPDIDNVIKVVADSLNGIAYKDDTLIVEVIAIKHYSEDPRIEISIDEMGAF